MGYYPKGGHNILCHCQSRFAHIFQLIGIAYNYRYLFNSLKSLIRSARPT